ncbi:MULTISPECIES: TetR/AcrR family transcriptional regulator [unclassified Gordonia (in: high G+C Gram-positive bacteria)]
MNSWTPVQLRFFAAAMGILADEGYGALKMNRLCEVVGVTTGSFYHSFDNWQSFTRELLANWGQEQTERIARQAERVSDAERQVDWLLEVGLDLPHASEAAIRTWAGVDAEVKALQREVDAQRLETVTKAFTGVVGDVAAARQLAREALFLVVGFQQAGDLGDLASLETALRRIPIDAHRLAERRAASHSDDVEVSA